MEVDDLAAPDDLKAKLLAMTDTLTAEEKAEPMMAAPAPQAAAPAAPLNTETKKKKLIHFPVKQLGTLAACLAVCVLGYSTLHLGIGMGSAKSSAPALYAAEGAADSSAASVAAGGFDLQHAALDSTPEAVEICDDLEMNQSAVSHQLKILKVSKLITSRRDGKAVYYRLADEHVKTIIAMGKEHIEE